MYSFCEEVYMTPRVYFSTTINFKYKSPSIAITNAVISPD